MLCVAVARPVPVCLEHIGTSFVGFAAAGYCDGVPAFKDEWTAAFIIFFVFFIYPFYVRPEVSTVPEFLQKRYDKRTRRTFPGFNIPANLFLDSAGGLFAGIDSVLNSVSTLATLDFIKPPSPNPSETFGVRIGQMVTVVFMVLGWAVAVSIVGCLDPTVRWCDPFAGMEGRPLGQGRNESATTTPAVRAAIQGSQASLAQLGRASFPGRVRTGASARRLRT